MFGDAKACLAGLSFESADEILVALQGLLEGIEKGPLEGSFLSRWTG
jgi:hypothetical protein